MQRTCTCGNHTIAGGECSECAKKRSSLQRKLAVGASNDPLELEADRIADQVLAAPAHSAVSIAPPQIQRFTGGAINETDSAPTSVDRVLAESGRPLDASLRQDMESRFGHDFSQVRVHSSTTAGQSAQEMGAQAYTVGNDVVFAPDHFEPTSSHGRRLIAHELAHVVQQSASQARTLAASDIYPASPRVPGAQSGLRVQRFTEPGHKLIGDEAFGIELMKLAGVEMTFGDAVALGDYFGSIEDVRKLATKEGIGRNSRGVVRYVLWVKIRKHKKESKLGEWYDENASFQAEQISRSQDSKNISHFPNPRTGDTALDPLQKNQRIGDDQKPLGAAATYRQAHEKAMWMAYINGTHQQGNDDALLADGFACHFLTDSFSASHLRTPRASIKQHWDQKVPGFRKKLIQWLADQINRQPLSSIGPLNMLERLFAITGFPFVKTPNSTVRSAAITQLSILLSGGDYSFGDVVSLIVHDAEGAATVDASIDGSPITLVGDLDLVDEKPLDPMDPGGEKTYSLKAAGAADRTAKAAIAAVKASLEDIYDAYAAGLPENLATVGLGYAGFGSFDRTFHHKNFNTFKKDALGRRGLYRAEQLIPTAVEDKLLPPDKKTLPWMQASVDDLLAPNNTRIGKALELFGKGEAKEFKDRLKDMKDLKPEHRAVIEKMLIAPLESGDANLIRKLLRSILAGAGANLVVGPQGVSDRAPDKSPAKDGPPKKQLAPKTLKSEGVDLGDPVASGTAAIIDEVLLRNQRLAPYIGDRLKSGFRIAEKGKFIRDSTDGNFDAAYRNAYELDSSNNVSKATTGFFDSKKSEVHLRPGAAFGTALHESVHRLASPALYSLYLQVAKKISSSLTEVLKEGVTAFFTDLILRDEQLPNFNDAYRTQKSKVGNLIKALGTDGFDLIANFNFKGVGIIEIGEKLGYTRTQFSAAKGKGVHDVLKLMDKAL